jgi:DNA-directed RNA polymerase subunit RPC12/RpoP
MYSLLDSTDDKNFELILRDGITAAKCGRYTLAQSLLRQAILLNGSDARPYIWLSSTTEDLGERREYLELAVAADPTNVAARRGLAMLMGKIDQRALIPEGATGKPFHTEQVDEVQAESFACPKCGGLVSFDLQTSQVTCKYCGYQGRTEDKLISDQEEKPLDFVLPTTLGHRWADAQQRVSCTSCGAVGLLPPGQKTTQCPYCGSNQMIASSNSDELIDPQGIALMKFDPAKIQHIVKKWLGRGFFAPDDLVVAVQRLFLRPAYYSCWAFSGNMEMQWKCEVNEGTSKNPHWLPRSGIESSFFDNVLVSGVSALTQAELKSIEPFNMKEILEFKPDYLAGWLTMVYDRSVSNASLLAREKVTKKMRGELGTRVEIGREKRNLTMSAGDWIGMTYKHLLLPVWIGTYRYRGKEFHLLVNGQTGKVGGRKPRDTVKVVLSTIAVATSIFLLAWVLIWFAIRYGIAFR